MSGPAAYNTSSSASYAPQPRYPARQDSWTRDYEEVVEFPGQFHERDRMLPAHPPTPSSSVPTFQAQQQHALGLPQSTSHPARLSPPGIMSAHDQSPPNNAARPLHSSPLNPSTSAPPTPGLPQPSSTFGNARPGSRTSLHGVPTPSTQPGTINRIANEELRALTGPYPNAITPGAPGSRGSMILYRRADSFVGSPNGEDGSLAQQQGYFMQPPPPLQGVGGGGSNRASMYSVSGDSIVSMAVGDSKYPPSLFAATPRFTNSTPLPGTPPGPINTTGVGLRHPVNSMYTDPVRGSMFSDNRTSIAFSLNYGGSVAGGGKGLVAYAYDPEEDDDSEDDEDDWLHDPEVAYPKMSIFGGGKAPPPPPPRAPRPTAKSSASESSSGGHSSASTDLKGKLPSHPPLRTSQPTPPKATGPPKPLRVPHPSTVPKNFRGTASWSWRGIINITTLIAMIGALLCLFMVYPMIRNRLDQGVNARITGNTRINATGQAVEGPADNAGGGSTSRSRSILNPQGGVERRGAVETGSASALLDWVVIPSSTPSASMEIPSEWYRVQPAPAPAVPSVTGVRGVVYRPSGERRPVQPTSTGTVGSWPTHVPMPMKKESGSLGSGVEKEGQVVFGEKVEQQEPATKQGTKIIAAP